MAHGAHTGQSTPAAVRPTLPNTGAPIDPWLLALGGSLVVAGTGAVVRARR